MFRLPLLVLNLQQGLFTVADSDAILIVVVLDDAGGGVVQHDLSSLPKVDVLNPIVAGLAIVGHYNLVDEFLLDLVPPMLLVLTVVLLVNVIDHLQHVLAIHNLVCTVNL